MEQYSTYFPYAKLHIILYFTLLLCKSSMTGNKIILLVLLLLMVSNHAGFPLKPRHSQACSLVRTTNTPRPQKLDPCSAIRCLSYESMFRAHNLLSRMLV